MPIEVTPAAVGFWPTLVVRAAPRHGLPRPWTLCERAPDTAGAGNAGRLRHMAATVTRMSCTRYDRTASGEPVPRPSESWIHRRGKGASDDRRMDNFGHRIVTLAFDASEQDGLIIVGGTRGYAATATLMTRGRASDLTEAMRRSASGQATRATTAASETSSVPDVRCWRSPGRSSRPAISRGSPRSVRRPEPPKRQRSGGAAKRDRRRVGGHGSLVDLLKPPRG